MPRLTVKVPKYRLHRASGQAVVTLTGRDLYIGAYNSDESKAEYNRLIAEWQMSGRQLPVPVRSNSLSVDELILAFLEHAHGYYVKNGRPTTTQRHIRDALRPLHDLYGATSAAEFGPLALKALRQELIHRGNWCRTTINKAIGIIKRMFKWAAENELLPSRVYHNLQTVSGLRRGRCEARETEPVKPVAEAFIDAVFPYVSSQVRAMIQLQLLTGMRPGEVISMRGCDLETSDRVWSYTPESHKTEHYGRARIIYLGPKAQAVVRPCLKTDVSAFLFNPTDAETERSRGRRANRMTPMTPSQLRRKRKKNPRRAPRDRYERDSYRRAIERGCEKAFPSPAGLSPGETKTWRKDHRWHPNQLRHNAATRLRKEFGIEAARVVLGHASAAVTEVYAELDLMKAADVMAKIG